MLILLSLALILSLFGFAVNIYRLINLSEALAYDYISIILMMFVTILLTVIIISVMISSKYTLTKEKLTSSFGIVKSEIPVKDMNQIVLFKKTEKLVIYFGKDKYSVIVVKKEWYDDFIMDMRQLNPDIIYDIKNDLEEE
jgi:hypothetical protein